MAHKGIEVRLKIGNSFHPWFLAVGGNISNKTLLKGKLTGNFAAAIVKFKGELYYDLKKISEAFTKDNYNRTYLEADFYSLLQHYISENDSEIIKTEIDYIGDLERIYNMVFSYLKDTLISTTYGENEFGQPNAAKTVVIRSPNEFEDHIITTPIEESETVKKTVSVIFFSPQVFPSVFMDPNLFSGLSAL